MIGYNEQKQMVDAAMAQFPATFGLAAFPGDTFRISRGSSYVNDSRVVMLYTERLVNGEWESFVKGTVSELLKSIRPLNPPAPAIDHNNLGAAVYAASLDHTYQVIVGNIGTVFSGNDVVQANRDFDEYVSQSQTGRGRAAGEPVTFMVDGEPTREYTPAPAVTGPHFDYVNQAWTVDGRYVACAHPDAPACKCYGNQHAGELAPIENLPTVPRTAPQTLTVSELPAALQFVSDSQDVDAVKEHIGQAAQEFDSFFVNVQDGDYSEVWGMCGIVPLNSKMVTRIH